MNRKHSFRNHEECHDAWNRTLTKDKTCKTYYRVVVAALSTNAEKPKVLAALMTRQRCSFDPISDIYNNYDMKKSLGFAWFNGDRLVIRGRYTVRLRNACGWNSQNLVTLFQCPCNTATCGAASLSSGTRESIRRAMAVRAYRRARFFQYPNGDEHVQAMQLT